MQEPGMTRLYGEWSQLKLTSERESIRPPVIPGIVQ
jgi:hypothetical protein